MKKFQIIFVLVFVLSIFLFSCEEEEKEDYMSTLIVNNLPPGDYNISVYNTDISEETLKINYNKHTGFTALANGSVSPFNLIWYESISSGSRYVIIRTFREGARKAEEKVIIASFSGSGDATVDWDDMIDLRKE